MEVDRTMHNACMCVWLYHSSFLFPILIPVSLSQRIVSLLTLASTASSALASIDPGQLSTVGSDAVRDYYVNLRLIYSSLAGHIRMHAGELQHMGGVGSSAAAVATAGGSASSSSAAAAASAAAAFAAANTAQHEYRRNIYIDTQSVQLGMESLDVYKERIIYANEKLNPTSTESSPPMHSSSSIDAAANDDSTRMQIDDTSSPTSVKLE